MIHEGKKEDRDKGQGVCLPEAAAYEEKYSVSHLETRILLRHF